MVISRKQMILDLTVPFPKIFVYKDPIQREDWGYFDYSMILLDYSQESSWRTFFPNRKKETDTVPIILDREALT